MIKVSIVVAIYNHEKYLKQAINSILMQKVNFDYEVLIGEDCSTDSSRKVLQEIEPNLPSNYHIYYREHNYGAIENFYDLYRRMKGKYYIVLEGDDYWISPNKLQKQVDFLDKHPEYIAVAHNCEVVDKNGNPQNISYPECKRNEYTSKEWRKRTLPGQTATMLMKNYFSNELSNKMRLQLDDFMAGDQVKVFLLLCNGKIWCIQERLSAYRYVFNEGDSFSASYKGHVDDNLRFYMSAYEYCMKYGVERSIVCGVENNILWELLRVKLKDKNNRYSLINEWRMFHFKVSDVLYVIHRIIGKIKDKITHDNSIKF